MVVVGRVFVVVEITEKVVVVEEVVVGRVLVAIWILDADMKWCVPY